MDDIADGIWLTGELLTPDECKELLMLSRENGFHDAFMKSHGRYNRESFLKLPEVAAKILSGLNSEIVQVSEISSTLQCYVYARGDRVDPHYDAIQHVKDGKWSAFTLVIYLNDGFTGGATGFPDLGIELSAPPGHAVLFKQSLLHEGQRVVTGEKYVVTTVVC